VPIITDKRGYQPLCTGCMDQGCEACEPQRATILNVISQQEEAQEFLERVKEVSGQMIPRTHAELITLVAAAIEYGRYLQTEPLQLETETGLPPKSARFDLLEFRDEVAA